MFSLLGDQDAGRGSHIIYYLLVSDSDHKRTNRVRTDTALELRILKAASNRCSPPVLSQLLHQSNHLWVHVQKFQGLFQRRPH